MIYKIYGNSTTQNPWTNENHIKIGRDFLFLGSFW